MLTPQLHDIFNRFNDLNALILGDVMVDSYLWGKVNRISPEAPVPVVSVTEVENRLGGAANVALNVAAMGARPMICAVVGDDEKADLFNELLEQSGLNPTGVVRSPDRPTTVKTRIISSGQHLLRVDQEKTDNLNEHEQNMLLQRFNDMVTNDRVDVVIMQDYNKGVLSASVIESVIEICREKGIPTAVDPKKENFLAYRGVDLFKPNLKELREGMKMDFDGDFMTELKGAIKRLEDELQNRISLITLSERGVACNTAGEFVHLPAHDRKIIDVSGAGDTVISVAALCLALGLEPRTMATLSNLSGGLVCEQVGVVPIDKEQLLSEASLLHPIR